MYSCKTPEDRKLYDMLPKMELLSPEINPENLKNYPGMRHSVVQMPDEFGFLHETAVIEFHGTLFAAWYNNYKDELKGFTPIRERRSADGGKTWSAVRVIKGIPEDRLLFCPPVFGIQNDTLYLYINTMVSGDHMHSMDLYRFNEKNGNFVFLNSLPIPFKLNTNVYTLPNGKLFHPGRIAEKLDEFPLFPACLISDSGNIESMDWRAVGLQQSEFLPDGLPFGHAECSAVVRGNEIDVFCREDSHSVPLLFVSRDCGETWDGPFAHDIPFSNSKIYSGTLSDGRNYVIGNLQPERERLAIFLSEPGTLHFTSAWLLHSGHDEALDLYPQWSYPSAYESCGNLYVIYTMLTPEGKRGAILSILPL